MHNTMHELLMSDVHNVNESGLKQHTGMDLCCSSCNRVAFGASNGSDLAAHCVAPSMF